MVAKNKSCYGLRDTGNNTKMFHTVVNGGRSKKIITRNETSEGSILEDDKKIEEKIVDYFKLLYSGVGTSRP